MSTELDKFKRRVIRSVARVLRQGGQDKQADQRMWDALQKEVGCDCKLLWERMRTLTLKKMKRLLPADDRLRAIAEVAQMQLTDWLLFDLVLVHEDIDVITDDPNSKAMKDLVNLVQMFEIEGKKGDALTAAWTAATFYYNSFGRQCSPMLLQRRWYQLKKATRSRFYTFWFDYRGNARLLEMAKKSMPNSLNTTVAQKYPYIIIRPFKEWEELIKEKLVILPEEFEAKMRTKTSTSQPDDKNEPDLVLVEPEIETIDLGVDSDDENGLENSKDPSMNNEEKEKPLASIKQEIEDEIQIDIDEPCDDAMDIPEDIETRDSLGNSETIEESSPVEVTDTENSLLSETNDDVKTVVKAEATEVVNAEVTNDVEVENDVVINEGSDELVKQEVQEEVEEDISDNAEKLIEEISDDSEKTNNETYGESDDVEKEVDEIVEVNNPVAKIQDFAKVNQDVIGVTDEALSRDISEEMLMPQITNVFGNVNIPAEKLATLPLRENESIYNAVPISINVDENIDDEIKRKADEFTTKVDFPKRDGLVALPIEKVESIDNAVSVPIEVDENIDDEIKRKADEFTTEVDFKKSDGLVALPIEKVESTDNAVSVPIEVDENIDDEIKRKADEFTTKIDFPRSDVCAKDVIEIDVDEKTHIEKLPTSIDVKKENIINPFGDISADLTFVDDGIEFVDDGIEFVEDDDDEVSSKDVQIITDTETTIKSDPDSREETSKIDKKLLMVPVVYLVKLENMTVFKDKDIITVRDKTIMDSAFIESKTIVPKIKKEKDIDTSIENTVLESKPTITTIKTEIDPDGPQYTVPQEEAKIPPDASDSDGNEIPEDMKVKLSSYLLQKPKSRSYHPIQLCKNPDFNTRLKRLTFGFLSSMRNRFMLKKLKPMTIDLSKAFEGKLINGTLYLKGGDVARVKTEPVFEEQIEQTINVMPSATPVQSLIDNIHRELLPPECSKLIPAKLNTIEHKTNESVLMERQKTINLPDINHIRRINQQLLTAEVTPMISSMNNDKYKPPVQLVAAQSALPASDNTENLGTREDINVKPKVKPAEAVDPKPHAIPDITHRHLDSDKDTVKDDVTTSILKGILSTEAKIPQTPEIASVSSSSQPDKATLNKSNKIVNEKLIDPLTTCRVKPAKNPLPWTCRQFRSRPVEDSLLTLDTLQKMLILISETENPTGFAKLKPRQLKRVTEKRRLDLEKRLEYYERALTNDVDKLDDETEEEEKPPMKKTKANITKDDKNKFGEYCCWARMKMSDELVDGTKHPCPRICVCCCRTELASKTKWSSKKKQNSNEIIISDDEDGKKISDTIENVIKQSTQTQGVPKSKRKRGRPAVKSFIDSKGNQKTEVSIQCDLESQIDSELQETSSALKSILSPKPKESSPIKPLVRIVKHLKSHPPPSEVISLDDTVDATGKAAGVSRASPQPLSIPTGKNNLVPIAPKVHGHIIIDGTQGFTMRHRLPTTDTSAFRVSCGQSREKVIYINNKKKDGTPFAAPIYLGRNKILLTDIKFPSYLSDKSIINPLKTVEHQPTNVPPQLINMPSQLLNVPGQLVNVPQQPVNVPPVLLPPGIQLFLLPTGVLTYTSDPNVDLTDEQKARMPAIIAAVQEQLFSSTNALLASVSAPSLPRNNTEVKVTRFTDVDDVPQVNIESSPALTEPLINTDALIETNKEQTIGNISVPEQNTNTEAIQFNLSTSKDLEVLNTTQELAKPSQCEVECYSKNKSVSRGVTNDDDLAKKETTLTCNDFFNEDGDIQQSAKTIDDINKVDAPGTGNEATSQKAMEIDEVKENELQDKNTPSEAAPSNNRKSLLSDLMEMSGIGDEDVDTIAPIPNEIPGVVSNLPTGIVPAEVASQGVIPIIDLASDVQPMVNLTTGQIPVPSLIPTTPTIEANVAELTPIISYAQLKYACDKNGSFFKLDLENGTLACGIKICIKKQMPKSVIDLTDDEVAEAQITQEPSDNSLVKEPNTYSLPQHLRKSLLKISNKNTADPVKPIKLFKSVRILKKDKEHTVLLPANLETDTGTTGKHQRKQNLEEVRYEENTTEVLDENILESASLDQDVYEDTEYLSPFESGDSDSSDDEPLASKAKRIRKSEFTKDDAKIDGKVKSVANMVETDDQKKKEQKQVEAMNLVPENSEKVIVNNVPQEDQDELSNNLMRELPENFTPFIPDDDEDGDCILGV